MRSSVPPSLPPASIHPSVRPSIHPASQPASHHYLHAVFTFPKTRAHIVFAALDTLLVQLGKSGKLVLSLNFYFVLSIQWQDSKHCRHCRPVLTSKNILFQPALSIKLRHRQNTIQWPACNFVFLVCCVKHCPSSLLPSF